MGERFIPCPSNEEARKGCKYAPDCHLSEHHLYPKRTGETKLKRAFGNLAVNKVTSCRMIHDVLDTFPPPEYPEPAKMKEIYEEQSGKAWSG